MLFRSNVVTDLTKTASNAIDTVKTTTINGIKTVDTSSNFKMIYSDLKDGIVALGSSLKVGAEHVYIVLVKQQIVYSITNIFVYIFLLIILYIPWKWFLGIDKNDRFDEPYILLPIFLSIPFIVFFCITIQITVSGIINPEFGAIKDVIQFVQGTSNTCSTCH
mgnify:CR=1 FL=1